MGRFSTPVCRWAVVSARDVFPTPRSPKMKICRPGELKARSMVVRVFSRPNRRSGVLIESDGVRFSERIRFKSSSVTPRIAIGASIRLRLYPVHVQPDSKCSSNVPFSCTSRLIPAFLATFSRARQWAGQRRPWGAQPPISRCAGHEPCRRNAPLFLWSPWTWRMKLLALCHLLACDLLL
jgi:hypothetical protein